MNNKSNRNYNNKNYDNSDDNNNFFIKLLTNVASNIKETNNEELSKSYHLLCKLLSNKSYRISFNQLNYVRTNLGLTKRTFNSNKKQVNNEQVNNNQVDNEQVDNNNTKNLNFKLDTVN